MAPRTARGHTVELGEHEEQDGQRQARQPEREHAGREQVLQVAQARVHVGHDAYAAREEQPARAGHEAAQHRVRQVAHQVAHARQ